MLSKSPKIAILINDLEGRYQSLVKSGIEQFSLENECRLFYFVGKSLKSPYEDEEVFNTIYDLAGSVSMDGYIVTSGAIGNYQESWETEKFLQGFFPKPIVNIGSVVPTVPSVFSDCSIGLCDLIRHFIEDHDFKRIAYLGGSLSNPEGVLRRDTFIHEMAKRECPVDEKLILTGDFSYQSGNLLAEKLVQNNVLLCDAIICANDEMALGLMEKLGDMGFQAPRDFAVAGIDNIFDSHFSSPPLTSVEQFLPRQAYLACENLVKIINDTPVPLVLQERSSLIRRESCGCGASITIQKPLILPYEHRIPLSSVNIRSVIDSILEKSSFQEKLVSEIRNAVSALLENLILDVKFNRPAPLFLHALRDWLHLSIKWNNFANIWYNLLDNCQNELKPLLESEIESQYVDRVFQKAFASIAMFSAQKEVQSSNKLKWVMNTLNAISARLNYYSDFRKALEAASMFFPSIGIDEFHIVLEGQDLSLDGLAQDSIFESSHGLNILMPLTFRHESFGYMSLSGRDLEPLVCNSLRSSISQIIFSMKLQNQKNHSILDPFLEELLPAVILEADLEKNIVSFNIHAGRFFNLQNPQGSIQDLIPDEDWDRLQDALKPLETQQSIAPFPGIRIKGSSDRTLPIAGIKGVFRSDGTTLKGFFLAAFDFSSMIDIAVFPSDKDFRSLGISSREKDVLKEILKGQSIKGAAEALFVSESTVKGHLSRMYSKLDVSGKEEMRSKVMNQQIARYGYSEYLFAVLDALLKGE